jgi:glycosyltransferase involved in cell wall biosynthesis
MPELPGCDVVIPAYNAERFVGAAIDSALNQTGFDVRVWVVDDASSDGTPEAVEAIADPRVTLVADRGRLGIGAARNIGASLGSAPWLTFLDADDLWPRARTELMVAAISNPSTDIVIGRSLTFVGVAPPLDISLASADTQLAPVAGGVLFSRVLFEAVGNMPEDLRMGEFIEWMARARLTGAVEKHIPHVTLLRRSHAHNTTRTRTHEFTDYLTVVARVRAARATQRNLKA